MSPPERYDLPEAVLAAAMSRLVVDDDRQRDVALHELIAAYPEHGEGLRCLCAALDGAGRVLTRTFAAPPPERAPHIEGYRIVRRLGEGAFGVVYLCEQHEPIHRQVALKLLRPGAGDRGTLARFDSEREFLARLNHPAIAQIFGAGLLPDGRPWFVMEYVPGVPLTQYCDRAQLPIEARLALFVRLCHGVQHAHEQGIVHRDLKPANILVVEVDGAAQPKIIDFGVARALQPSLERAELRTETGRVVGTPGYMGPEQAAGRHDEIDARSDLFSLGVVLYELLAGELPWGKQSTDSEPPRPSKRVGSSDQRTTKVAQRRSSQPKKLASLLRGDLDWIVLKALERERSRRYPSAAELGSEIQRHLRGEAVRAGPPTLRYRLRKFARRRRTALAAAAVVMSTLAAGIVIVDRYRNEAHARSGDAAAAVASLLARAQDEDVVSAPRSERVRKSLAQEALRIYEQFLADRPEDPVLREGHARTLTTLAQVHCLIGGYSEAERAAREAIADLEPLLALDPDRIAYQSTSGIARLFLGRALHSMGQEPAGRRELESALELLGRCHALEPAGHTEPLVAVCRELAALFDPATESVACLALLARARAAQDALVRRLPESAIQRETLMQIDVVRSMALAAGGDLAAAMQALGPSDELIATRTDIGARTVASVHVAAAQILAGSGDVDQALPRLEQAVAVTRAWVEREPGRVVPRTLLAQLLSQLAAWQDSAGLGAVTITTCRAATDAAEAWLARSSTDPAARVTLIECLSNLAKAFLRTGRRSGVGDAESCARRAAQLASSPTQQLESEGQLCLRWRALGNLGLVADCLGLADAEAIWSETEQALHVWRAGHTVRAQVADDFVAVSVRIARRYVEAGRDEAASALLAEAVRVVDQFAADVPDLAICGPEACRLSAVLAARGGELDGAAELAEHAQAVGNGWRGCLAAAIAMDAVRHAAGADAAPATHLDRAIELHERAIEVMAARTETGPEDLWVVVPLAQSRIRLALARHDRGDPVHTSELANALDTLSALRSEVFACEWDEALFRAGESLRQD